VIKIYLGSFALLSASIIIGVLVSESRETSAFPETAGFNSDGFNVVADESTTATFTGEGGGAATNERLKKLESELASINARLKLIESGDNPVTYADDQPGEASDATSEINVFGGPSEPVAVVEGLVAAGLDSFTAEQIARRVSESELRRLELRDKAIREGYIGSEQYREEMMALRDAQVRVKDEIDESTYDRYLYYSGQSNRVAVSSVMLGSAAESSGVQAGDVLLRYEDSSLYKPGDIRGLTSQGEKNETVNLTLLRDGNQMTVSVPRGPLGVRLSAIRINPEDN